MRRFAAVVIGLVMAALPERATARGSQSVVIVRPDASTCIDPQALAGAMVNAGAILPSVVPEDAARRAPSGAVVVRIDSGASGLRIRAWGLRHEAKSEILEGWPLAWSERAPDLDREIPAPDCETATEAVVAFLVSVLEPSVELRPPASGTDRGSKLASVLELASAELAERSHLTAGVLHTELGLTFIVEDLHATCRRGTWLDLRGRQPRMGQTVAELERDVEACLRERELAERQRGLGPATPVAPPLPAERFGLPLLTGGVVAGLGVAAGYVAVVANDNPTPVLAFTTFPALVGGAVGYLASGPGREALWLSGYWSSVAGSSLVAAAQSGSAKPVLVGSFIAGGTATSAALVALDAMHGDDARIPAWAISMPAVAGAALSWVGQFVSGDGRNSVEIAVVGSFAALLPAFWIALQPDPRADTGASTASLGVSLGEAGAELQLRGEL